MTKKGKAKPSDRVGFTTFSWFVCRKCINKEFCEIKEGGETDRLSLEFGKGSPLKTVYLTCGEFEEADRNG